MLISHKRKFIFIHIYKNAGTSITSALLKHADFSHNFVNKRPYNYILSLINRLLPSLSSKSNSWLVGFRKHATALEIKDGLTEDEWDVFYKFAFVRNPYSHIESLYSYIKGNRSHKYFRLIKDKNFDEFVEFYCSKAFRLQNEFVRYGDDIVVDFVGHVEKIQYDLEKVCKDIGIEYEGCPFKNAGDQNSESLWCKVSQDSLKMFNSYAAIDFNVFNYNICDSVKGVCENDRAPSVD